MTRHAHLFPRYHVRPPSGYMNDPNGPIVRDGLVHLYFQYRDTLDHASPVLWGHVTSTDLVHWDYHRPALTPHPLALDRDGCWSGNTIMDDSGRIRAFYSGHVMGQPLQNTLSAVSDDGGFSFGPPREVVGEPPEAEDIQVLRDPFVWREGASWKMVIGAGADPQTAMIREYTSKDLDTWVYQGPMARLPRTTTRAWDSGSMWECPQVVLADTGPIALVGSWSPQMGIMTVLSLAAPPDGSGPDIDPSALHLVDHGPNFYAPSVLNQSPHGPILWGWATEGRSAAWCAEEGWSGMLTLPRVVTPRSGGELASAPVPEITALRTHERGREVNGELTGVGAQFEFEITCPRQQGEYSLMIDFGPEEHLAIRVDASADKMTIDRNHASRDDRADRGQVVIEGIGTLTTTDGAIRGFVDGSILEVFLPNGKVATTRFYPTSPPPWRMVNADTPPIAHVLVWGLADQELPDPWSSYRATD